MKSQSTELTASNTDKSAQNESGGDKINLPSLPDSFNEDALINAYKRIEKEAKSEVPDIETEEGRKHIKEMARKVAASKTAIDTPIRDYLRMIKAQPKVLEKNARESKQRFDDLKAEILKPLEEAQKSQDDVINWLNNVPSDCGNPEINSKTLANIIETINGYTDELVWPELKKKFKVAHENALTTATVTLERITEQEKQAAELAELRAKQAKAEEEERNRKIAEEAAAKARAEAEQKAQQERESLERRAAENKHREEQAAIREEQAKQVAIESEKNRIAEVERSKAREAEALKQAEEKSRLAAEEAIEAEKRRAIEAEKEQARLAKARAEDKELRIKVNRANLVVLIAAGFSDEDGKKFIKMVARGELPDIKIHY